MPDKTLICVECGNEFIFSDDEQYFYREWGLTEPGLCITCLDKAKGDRRGRARFSNPEKENSNGRH